MITIKHANTDPLAGIGVIDYGSQARQDGLKKAYDEYSTFKWQLLYAAGMGMLAASGGLTRLLTEHRAAFLAAWFSVAAALFATGAYKTRKVTQKRTDIVDNETALTRYGLCASGGIGTFPAALLNHRHSDPVVGELVDTYLATWQLSAQQEALVSQLLSENYQGTLAELHAAARALA